MIETLVAVVVALWSMLWPAHTHPETPFVVAVLVVLAGASLVSSRRAELPSLGTAGWSLAAGMMLVVASVDRWSGMEALVLGGFVVAVAWVARHGEPGPRHRAAFAIGAAVLGLWGVGQALGGLEGLRPELADVPSTVRSGFATRIDGGRGFAALLYPGHLAALLATALPLAMGRETFGRWTWIRWPVVMALVAGLIATRSPTGVMLSVLAVVVASVGEPRRWLIPGLVGVIAAAGMVWFRPDLLRLQPFTDRWDNWWSALWAWWQQPVAGTGLGGYGAAVHGIAADLANRPSHAHNLVLEWLAEAGIPGLVAAGALFWWVSRVVWRLRPRDPALAAAVVVVPIHNLVDFSWFNWGVAVPWAVVLGWGLATLEPRRQAGAFGWRAAIPAFGGALLVVILSGLHWWSMEGARAAEEMDSGPRARTLDRLIVVNPVNPSLRWAAARAWLEAPEPRPSHAVEILQRGRRLTPISASALDLQAAARLREGRPTDALADLWWAAALQPYSRDRQEALDSVFAPLRSDRVPPVADP